MSDTLKSSRVPEPQKKGSGKAWFKMKRVQFPLTLLALFGAYQANEWRVANDREAERAGYETLVRTAYPDAFKAASGLNVTVNRSPGGTGCCQTEFARDYPMGRMTGNIYYESLELQTNAAGRALDGEQKYKLVDERYGPDITGLVNRAFCRTAVLQISDTVTLNGEQIMDANRAAFARGMPGPYQCNNGGWRIAAAGPGGAGS